MEPFPLVPLTWIIFNWSRSSIVMPDLSRYFLVMGRFRWTFACLSLLVFFRVIALVCREFRAVTASSYDKFLFGDFKIVILRFKTVREMFLKNIIL